MVKGRGTQPEKRRRESTEVVDEFENKVDIKINPNCRTSSSAEFVTLKVRLRPRSSPSLPHIEL